MQSYNYFQPKTQAAVPKYASTARAPPKKVIANKYSKPVAQINLASPTRSSHSRGVSGGRGSNGFGSGTGSARKTSNTRKAAVAPKFTAYDNRKRESENQNKVVVPNQTSKFAHFKTENRLRELDDDDDMMDTNSQCDRMSVNSRGQPRKGIASLYRSNLDSQVAKMSGGEKKGIPVVGCMPGCTGTTCGLQECNFDYDYSKNYKDALNRRPGEFVEYNWMAANYYLLQQEKQGIVCDGDLQTPINLETNIPITQEFKDINFDFKYNTVDSRKQVKFNQKGQQMQVILESPKSPMDNFMRTSTINLFEKKIECCNLHGLQYHFHAPSEHSINGQLMDLEMHIVHGFEPGCKDKTKLSHGVLGFLFKAVPDDFPFGLHGGSDFHDRYMRQMLEESKTKYGSQGPPLDLSKFVKLLQFNRRWTYTGSLTTAPFSEGILWNVLEHVVPLRQTTLDMFLEYRKIEEKQVFNKFANVQEQCEVKAKLSIQPNNVKPWTSQKGETFFRVAACNRVVQDVGDREVYHIDIDP